MQKRDFKPSPKMPAIRLGSATDNIVKSPADTPLFSNDFQNTIKKSFLMLSAGLARTSWKPGTPKTRDMRRIWRKKIWQDIGADRFVRGLSSAESPNLSESDCTLSTTDPWLTFSCWLDILVTLLWQPYELITLFTIPHILLFHHLRLSLCHILCYVLRCDPYA